MVAAPNDRYLREETRAEAMSRVRVAAPVVAAILMVGLAASPIIGVSLAPRVLAANGLTIVVAMGIAALTWTGRVPSVHAHALSALTWLLLPVTTLATVVVVDRSSLLLPLIGAIFLAPSIMVSRVALAATTCGVAAAWWAISPTPSDGITVELSRVSVLGSTLLANVVGFFAARSVMDGARLRAELRATNNRLKRELRQRRRTEDERETFRDQFIAAQRSEAIGSLAAGLAHEMNNILAGVLTSAELLADDAPDADTEKAANAIAAEAQRGGALTQSLLAFARRGQYHRAPAALDEVVEEVRRVLPRTLRRTITLEHSLSSEAVVDVDRAQLIQAVLNLAINGADAMAEGGVLRLSTETETLAADDAERAGLPPGTYAVIAVTDTGHGMDSATRRRAFEPFYTTKPQGKGTGLGLAMVDGSVRAHGGSIEVQSVVGRGTTIRVYLPLYDGGATETAAVPERSGLLDGRVLVIDDEPLVRTALARSLRRVGLKVVAARDGAEGVAKFVETPGIMLTICDMNMPQMDGAACIRAIRGIRDVPVIIISGYAAESEARDLVKQGLAHAFLEKPFNRRQLLDAVDGVLGGDDSGQHPVAILT